MIQTAHFCGCHSNQIVVSLTSILFSIYVEFKFIVYMIEPPVYQEQLISTVAKVTRMPIRNVMPFVKTPAVFASAV